MTLKYPFRIPCSRLKSPQKKEQTKTIEVPFLPLHAQYPSTLWHGGGGSCPERVSKCKQEGGHLFPRLEGAREWRDNQGENSSHKVTLKHK